MNFESIKIKNFRNFNEITVKLDNKNIFFGLNDVGKTNFLYAIRYVLDKDIRKQSLIDSDFHNKNVDEDIEIIITIDISDDNCIDCKKLIAKLKGALSSDDEKVYIKLSASYNETEQIALPTLYWGGDENNLQEIKSKGIFYELDNVFNVIYIDSYVDLSTLFKKHAKTLTKNTDEDNDRIILDDIAKNIDDVNDNIAKLSGVQNFQNKITPEYQKFRQENIAISVKSEIAVKGLYSNLIPYIKRDGDDNLYPTAGEGRKKLLSYSIFDLIAEENQQKKINIMLIEEPENHLHKSMQIALSQILFHDEKYQYLFATTHSPYILYEMDSVNLIRVFNETKIDSTSTFYEVPAEFESNRKMLNMALTEAIFADKVLLVEGPSELMLFQKILSVVDPFFESKGKYILSINGIGFEKYYCTLEELGIKCLIKTDNDLRKRNDGKFSVIGFTRCNGYIPNEVDYLPKIPIASNSVSSKQRLYTDNLSKLNQIRCTYNIYLSKCDLENDLYEALGVRLEELTSTTNPVIYLQTLKHYNMVKLISKLTVDDCKKIFEHYNFACLKEVVK